MVWPQALHEAISTPEKRVLQKPVSVEATLVLRVFDQRVRLQSKRSGDRMQQMNGETTKYELETAEAGHLVLPGVQPCH